MMLTILQHRTFAQVKSLSHRTRYTFLRLVYVYKFYAIK